MKKTIIFLIVAAVGVVGLFLWRSTQPEATVQIITPRTETLRAFVEEQAVTELPRDVLIAMPISGWLEPIDLREGDPVAQDQVVARLDAADLASRVEQARNRVAVLETRIAQNRDHRLEQHALTDAEAAVKAINETVKASQAKLQAYIAIAEFAQSEFERIKSMAESDAAAGREIREAETNRRKAEAEQRANALDLAALKTIAAVSYIGPQAIRDYIDRKGFELNTLQAQLAEARADLAIEERNLARAELTSPIAGVVLERHQTRRQFLSAGTPLLTLGQLEDMETVAEVLTQRATRIAPGDPVEVFGEAIGDEPLAGRVLRVYPAGFKKISSLGVEQQRVKVAIALDRRPPALGVAYRVYVRIFYDQVEEALTLPRTAIFRAADGGWQAMVVADGETTLRDLELGLMNDDRAQVLAGVTAAEKVVARPSNELSPGMRVAVTDRKPPRE